MAKKINEGFKDFSMLMDWLRDVQDKPRRSKLFKIILYPPYRFAMFIISDKLKQQRPNEYAAKMKVDYETKYNHEGKPTYQYKKENHEKSI